jgi:PhnB protein
MKAVHPYLNFDGNTLEVFEFYRSVFGGEFTNVTRYADMGNGMGVPEAERGRIANIGLPLGGGAVLMATDSVSAFPRKLRPGNNFYITLEPESKEEAERVFGQLSEGGVVEMPLQHTEWAESYGSFIDRFGIGWMVNYSGAVEFTAGMPEEAG